MNAFRILLWPLRKLSSLGSSNSDDVTSLVGRKLTLEQYEALAPFRKVRDGTTEVRYSTPNKMTNMRVSTLFTKEPDTMEWIRGFQPGEVLVDIGANVGMYAIWAAKTRGVRVFAFEPESQNYALLYKNIVLNDLSHLVVGYCAALSDQAEFSLLHLSQFEPGISCHTFGEELGHNLEHRKSKISQGSVATTLDLLIETGVVSMPDHIKIDVDGLEHKVLAGCRATLRNPQLKSILIEINTHLEQHRNIIREMEELGFNYSPEQVALAVRTQGPFAGVGNYVFHR